MRTSILKLKRGVPTLINIIVLEVFREKKVMGNKENTEGKNRLQDFFALFKMNKINRLHRE